MAFPVNPADGTTYTDVDNLVYTYVAADKRWKRTGVSATATMTNATTTATGAVQLAGDLAGTATSPQLAPITGLTAGSYSLSNLTVDSKGRITTANNGTVNVLAKTATPNSNNVDVVADVNTIKNAFRSAESGNKPKTRTDNMVVDVYSDATGIDSGLSSGYYVSGGAVSENKGALIDWSTAGAQVASSIGDYASSYSAGTFASYTASPPTYGVQRLIDTQTGNGSYSYDWGAASNTSWDSSAGAAGATLTIKFPSAQGISNITLWMNDNYGGSHVYCDHQIEFLNPSTSNWDIIVNRVNLASSTDLGANGNGSWSYSVSAGYNPTQIRVRVWAHGTTASGAFGTMTEIQVFGAPSSSATVVSTLDTTSIAPTNIVLDAETAGTVTFDVSTDNGSHWLTGISQDTLVDLSTLPQGTQLRVRANLSNNGQVKSLGYIWYDANTIKYNQDAAFVNMMTQNAVDLIKTNFRSAETRNASKYTWQNFVVDAYNDSTGIDAGKSSGYAFDSTNKRVNVANGQKIYSTATDWNSLTQSQVQVINNTVKLASQSGSGGAFGAMANVESGSTIDNCQTYGLFVDSTGTAHVAFPSKRFNSGYYNIDYVTVTKAGVVSSPQSITSSTTANSYSASILVDSSGVKHIFFGSNIYNASYYNIGYVTVSATGTVSGITWLTTSTSGDSLYPTSYIDANNVKHLTFESKIYNSTYFNVAYMSISSTGTASSITWITTSTGAHSLYSQIGVDTGGTKHFVFHSQIYNASTNNIGYATVSSTGTVSGITWLTTNTTNIPNYNPNLFVDSSGMSHVVFEESISTTNGTRNIQYVTISSTGTVSSATAITNSTSATSEYPSIYVDSLGVKHVVFCSYIYNASYLNIGYATVSSTGTVSGITWLTTSTSADVKFPMLSSNGADMFVTDVNALNSVQYAYKQLLSYQTSGTLTGTIDAGANATWNEFVITDTLPANTSISLTYQTSNDNATWSTSTTATSGTALSGVTGRYMKYVVTLSTTDTGSTPTLTQLEVDWVNPLATVVGTMDTSNQQPTQVLIDAEYTGTVTFDMSLDNGTTWLTNITPDTLTDISSMTGTQIRVRANLSSGATLQSLGYAWFNGSQYMPIDPGTSNRMLENEINILKTNFKVSALQNASKYSMKNTIVEDYNDTTGINAGASSGYTWDSVNKLVKVAGGSNLLAGKTGYTVSPAFYGSYQDTNPTSKLTDGNLGTTTYTDGTWVAWDAATNPSVTFDLGSPTATTSMNIYLGSYTGNSMNLPTNIAISGSNDNATWTQFYSGLPSGLTSSSGSFGKTTATINFSSNQTYRYYKVTFTESGFMFLSEIQLIGVPATSATIVSTADTASSAPTQIVIDGEYTLNTGAVTFDVSIDGGTTWTTGVTPDTLANITSSTGTSVVSRVTLTNDATITSLGYSWN